MGTEGVVIYVCGEDDSVYGLVKVKSNEYVIKRRVREIFKRFIARLHRNEIYSCPAMLGSPKEVVVSQGEAVQELHQKLMQGMRRLAHVPGCDEMSAHWGEFSVGFAVWWVSTRLTPTLGLKAAVASRELQEALNEYDARFATLLAEYEAGAGALRTVAP